MNQQIYSLCDTCCTSWLDLFLTRHDLFDRVLFLQKELLILCMSSLSWISKLFSLKHRLFLLELFCDFYASLRRQSIVDSLEIY